MAARKLFGGENKRETNGILHIELDDKTIDIPWEQPERMVHLIFDDAKLADTFIKTLRKTLPDDKPLAQVSGEKLVIKNYRAKSMPNPPNPEEAVAVRLTYTQFQTLQNRLVPLPAAPGGPKTK